MTACRAIRERNINRFEQRWGLGEEPLDGVAPRDRRWCEMGEEAGMGRPPFDGFRVLVGEVLTVRCFAWVGRSSYVAASSSAIAAFSEQPLGQVHHFADHERLAHNGDISRAVLGHGLCRY